MTPWGWPDAVAEARKRGGTLEISWKWRFDQRRRAAGRAVRKGELRRVKGPPGSDYYCVAESFTSGTEIHTWLRARTDELYLVEGSVVEDFPARRVIDVMINGEKQRRARDVVFLTLAEAVSAMAIQRAHEARF